MKKYAASHSEPSFEQRQQIERRRHCFRSLIYIHKGRRIQARRQEEAEQGYYIDRYEKWVGINVIAITLFSALDAFLTLNILERGGIEVNPFMSALLAINTQVFLIGKFFITIVCVLFSLVHINFQFLRVFPMRYTLVCISVLYILLIRYELQLLATM